MLRTTAAIALLSLSLTPTQMPCWAVRQAVAQYGEEAVIAWAKANNFSDKTIAEHLKCLRPSERQS